MTVARVFSELAPEILTHDIDDPKGNPERAPFSHIEIYVNMCIARRRHSPKNVTGVVLLAFKIANDADVASRRVGSDSSLPKRF